MSTPADPVEMIRQGAPHLISDDEQLAEYSRDLFRLTAQSETTPEEDKAIDLLTLLIETYEQRHYPVLKADPVSVLRFLMDQNGLSQRDLVPEFGVESTVSMVLNGKRKMSRDHIARVSARFNVSPAVFFES